MCWPRRTPPSFLSWTHAPPPSSTSPCSAKWTSWSAASTTPKPRGRRVTQLPQICCIGNSMGSPLYVTASHRQDWQSCSLDSKRHTDCPSQHVTAFTSCSDIGANIVHSVIRPLRSCTDKCTVAHTAHQWGIIDARKHDAILQAWRGC